MERQQDQSRNVFRHPARFRRWLSLLGCCLALYINPLLAQEPGADALPPPLTDSLPTETTFVSLFPACDEELIPCVTGLDEHSDYPTGELSGFIQIDSAAFEQSPASMAAFGDINNRTAVRRARLALTGDLATDVGYKMDVEFATSPPAARDVYLDFRDRPYADRLVVGTTKVPFQMEALTSSKNFTFAERAPFFTFSPFRQVGIWADGTLEEERGTWSLAGFLVGKGGFDLNHNADGQGFAARTTYLHWYEDDGRDLLHTGLNYSVLQPFDQMVRYDSKLSFFTNQEPGINSSGPPQLVDTGNVPAESVNLFNFELAGSHGRFNYQAELTYALVNQIGGPPLVFYGGYAQAGWFFTGESKPYNRKAGVFDSVKPLHSFFDGGWGAWELAARGTFLNLNDKNVTGGRMNSAELALNWYLGDQLSVKFDYVHGFINNATADDLPIDVIGGRLQYIY